MDLGVALTSDVQASFCDVCSFYVMLLSMWVLTVGLSITSKIQYIIISRFFQWTSCLIFVVVSSLHGIRQQYCQSMHRASAKPQSCMYIKHRVVVYRSGGWWVWRMVFTCFFLTSFLWSFSFLLWLGIFLRRGRMRSNSPLLMSPASPQD